VAAIARSQLSGRRAIVALFAFALLVRIAALVATPDLRLAADPADYDRHARSIAGGLDYPESIVAPAGGPTAIRPPGFPLLLAAVYRLSGDSVVAGRVLQALLGAIVVVLIALIGRRLFGEAVGLVAGVLAAVLPPLVVGGMTLLSEPLFVAFELGAVLAALRWRGDPRLRWVVLAGALVGAAMLTRSTGVLLLLPLAVAVRGGPWRRPASYRLPALLVGCALLVVVPWTVRNAVVMDAFVPVSTQDGYTLAGTYNATSRSLDGLWLPANADPAYARLLAESAELDEVRLGSRLRAMARRFAVDHPAYLPELALHNTRRLFNLAGFEYGRQVAAGDYGLGRGWGALLTAGLWPFLLLALAGAFMPAARRAPPWFWSVPLLMLSTVLILATNRFRAPIDPFIVLLAAIALTGVWRRLR
jgi:4-amino-4-deoxy-L-arabinose transferase-like glycosyltransferase